MEYLLPNTMFSLDSVIVLFFPIIVEPELLSIVFSWPMLIPPSTNSCVLLILVLSTFEFVPIRRALEARSCESAPRITLFFESESGIFSSEPNRIV